MRIRFMSAAVLAFALVATLASAQVTKESVQGISNFSRVETTIACAGATSPSAVAEVKRLGYASIINLREASEQGADVEAESAAAKAAKIIEKVERYQKAPDTDIIATDRFIGLSA